MRPPTVKLDTCKKPPNFPNTLSNNTQNTAAPKVKQFQYSKTCLLQISSVRTLPQCGAREKLGNLMLLMFIEYLL